MFVDGGMTRVAPSFQVPSLAEIEIVPAPIYEVYLDLRFLGSVYNFSYGCKKDLDIEIFFADCIFDPAQKVVHGDFTLSSLISHGLWPRLPAPSGKGPYGSTGLYGKEEGDWERVDEVEWFKGVEGGFVRI